MKKIFKMYKTNRVFRTFIQAFVGYIIGNIGFAFTIMNKENCWKIILGTLIIPAVTTAYAQLTKNSYFGELTENEGSTIDDNEGGEG